MMGGDANNPLLLLTLLSLQNTILQFMLDLILLHFFIYARQNG